MKWLAQRQRERRWWTASASVAICGLVLGVIGIVPAFADLQAASCDVVETDGSVTVTWADVPDGLELIVLAEDADGQLATVSSDSGTIAGYGPTGSWTGDSHPGAVAYLIHGEPEDGGGTLRCGTPGEDVPVDVPAENAPGATNPGFDAGTCPTSSTGEEFGWAFVAPGEGRVVDELRVEFVDAGVVTFFVPGSTPGQVYVFTPGADEIVTATATISGPAPETATFELAFVCAPEGTPGPTPEPNPEPPAGDDGAGDDGTTADDTPVDDGAGDDGTTADDTPVDDGAGDDGTTADDTPVDDGAGDDGTTADDTPVDDGAGDDGGDDGGNPPPPPPPTSPRIEAKLSIDCPWDAVVVVVKNLGDVTGVAEIAADGVVIEVVTVEPGQRLTVMPETPLVDTTIEVFVGGVVVASATLDDPCANQEPNVGVDVTVDCVADTITVSLTNDGDGLGIVVVDIDGDRSRIRIMPGMIETVVVDTGGRSEVPITVRSGAETILSTIIDATCTDPSPEMSASVALVCDASAPSVRVVVTNDGDAPGTVTIDVDGEITPLTVAAGATETIMVVIPGDGPVAITVRDADGEVLAQLTDQNPCSTPEPELEAEAALDCVAGQIRVTVTNTGDAEGIATVEIDGQPSTVVVPAAGESVVTVDVTEGSTVRVRVHDGQRALLDETFSETCEQPSPELRAEVVRDCAAEELRVVVANDGDIAAEALITYAGAAVTLRVGPGQELTETFPMADAASVVQVAGPDGDGQTIIVEEIVDPCDEGSPSLRAEGQVDCQLGDVVVSIFNDGDAPGQVTWTINGRTEVVTVEAGASLVVSEPVIVAETNTWSVTVDGEVIAGGEVVDACRPDSPVIDAELVIDCGNDEIVVRVANSGAIAGDARVVINGEVSDVTVPAGDVVVVRVDLPADGSYLVDVSSAGENIFTEQGTATECDESPPEDLAASVAFSCRFDEAIVTVFNPSDGTREATVTVNGDVETVAVPAGDEVELAYPLVEDEPYQITVVDENGQSLAFARGVHDCVDVGGTTVINPNTPTTSTPMRLPNTGANSGVLAGAGLVLIASGLVAVRASKFRRDRIALG